MRELKLMTHRKGQHAPEPDALRLEEGCHVQ